MIQIRRLLTLLLLVLAMGLAANAQTYTREGNTFISSTGERVKAEPVKTKFTWKDNKGKEYRNYLGPEISEQICKELGIEYKGKKNKV